MESEGWITIEPSERGNGRVLSLTAAGANKLNQATRAWAQAQADAKALLGSEDAGTITQLVDRVWARQSDPDD
jgi:DNA-binding MarR family transcriptional regulator